MAGRPDAAANTGLSDREPTVELSFSRHMVLLEMQDHINPTGLNYGSGRGLHTGPGGDVAQKERDGGGAERGPGAWFWSREGRPGARATSEGDLSSKLEGVEEKRSNPLAADENAAVALKSAELQRRCQEK
ncbi:unnamed protein product [Merluccius merluccius]